MHLFVSKGAHAVTIAQIAQEATVGIGTVYKHFSSKEDIIQQISIWQKEQESVFVFKDYAPQGSVPYCFTLFLPKERKKERKKESEAAIDYLAFYMVSKIDLTTA